MDFRNTKSLFLAGLIFCFFAIVQAEVDPSFDSGSASMATRWQGIKKSLPHNPLPSNAESFGNVGSWAMDYAIGIGKLVGPGIAIGVLTLLGGLLYGFIKLVRLCCCCGKKDDDSESGSESSEEEEERNWCYTVIPTIIYVVCWVFVLTGMIFGLMNNPRFTHGVNTMGDDVISVGHDAVDLGQGVINSVQTIVALIPQTVTDLQDQFSGVGPLADNVVVLSNDINSTSNQVESITTEIAGIDAGNISDVKNLYAQLSSINNQSQHIISSVSDLTFQIANQLRDTLNSTVGNLDDKVGEIDDTVSGLVDTAQSIIKQATDLVDSVISYVNQGKSYDKTRGTALMVLFVLVIILTVCIVVGYIFKIKVIFNVVSAISMVFIVLLWLSGSIHFLLGMVLGDACPVIDVTVQGMLPSGSQASDVLQGCLYDHRSILDSLNITAYNLSDVFNYRSEFESFSDFSKTFNFSSIDGYFDSIQSLYAYNLTATANNLSVSAFGWNESVIYTALGVLNNVTYPQYYDLNNYTSANPANYSFPKNQTVYDTKSTIANLITLNQTIYNKTAVAKRQMLAAQNDINVLVSSMDALHARFTALRGVVNVLQTTNITNCINILDHLQSNITGFFKLGNCSFLGETFVDVKTALCDTMQPAIDCLTVGQFLAGIALIPIAILAEVLSFRVPKQNSVRPSCGSSDEESYDEEKAAKHPPKKEYAPTATDSPQAPRRNSGLTATIGATPSNTDSSEGSPDFNSNRRFIDAHFHRK